jgi:hypothetical protein
LPGGNFVILTIAVETFSSSATKNVIVAVLGGSGSTGAFQQHFISKQISSNQFRNRENSSNR